MAEERNGREARGRTTQKILGAFKFFYFSYMTVVRRSSGHKLNACEHTYWKILRGKMELPEMICLLALCIGPLEGKVIGF